MPACALILVDLPDVQPGGDRAALDVLARFAQVVRHRLDVDGVRVGAVKASVMTGASLDDIEGAFRAVGG